MNAYLDKWKGGLSKSDVPDETGAHKHALVKHIPPIPPTSTLATTALGSLIGIGAVALLNQYASELNTEYTFIPWLFGSQGATAVLVYAAPHAALAQPRHVILGNAIGAIVGVSCRLLLLDAIPWLAATLAVSVTILLCQITRTVHPPGAATALLAVIGGVAIEDIGWLFVPLVVAGSAILVVSALICVNLDRVRRYPIYWWGDGVGQQRLLS